MFSKVLLIVASVTLIACALPGRVAGSPAPASGASEREAWKALPVVPGLSARALAIYRAGIARGNNPRAFSKIGDGEVAAPWFLANFDQNPRYYNLGPYTGLAPVIGYFSGSLGRSSQAARAGFNTTAILSPAYASRALCAAGESPLACELRLQRPSFAFISLGTNQVWAPQVLEPELRQIVETLIAAGVVPILSTKGDNLEGDHCINAIIAQVAADYDVPLWNFWQAVQPLPAQGLQADHEHLTWAANDFGSAWAMQRAWPVRNLTALQTLQALSAAARAAEG